jgi:1-aminocyclopropane-1-carboxylate deaminase/D-cysteine desulfhydrase-like pyridoxal-dependent ACC family enzyme
MENFIESVMQNHIRTLAKKEEDLIMSCFKKQKGFISVEESKHLIEIRRMMKFEEHVETDYVFDGKVILTIYPPKFQEDNGKFNAVINYQQYD